MHRLLQARIDLDALRHNHALACRLAGSREVWPVVKGDAYGHGMVQVARALGRADGFCVADVDEGLALRAAGVRQPVLVIQGALSVDAVLEAAQARLILGLHRPEQLPFIEAVAPRLPPASLAVWLKLETGMHRLGLSGDDRSAVEARLRAHPAIMQLGLMMHFACADQVHPLNERQAQAFRRARTGFAGPTSASNSAALLRQLDTEEGVVRPGIMLYGASPFVPGAELDGLAPATVGLQPVMELHSQLLAVKEVPAGESVGYGASWVAHQPTRIGLVAGGYGDGIPRRAGHRDLAHAPVRLSVRGQRVPVIGRVSMDSLAVDLSAVPEARSGDGVVFWGSEPSVDEVASALGTIGYEMLAGLTARVPRIYTGAREDKHGT